MIRLGVNIDHVATLRNVRGETYPEPVHAALEAELGGASNITCHLREDRRHIRDEDVLRIQSMIKIPLNLEIAATDEMIAIAKKVNPQAVTLVPEKRQELTTEGGLNLSAEIDDLQKKVGVLKEQGILVCLFVEPDMKDIELSKKLGADSVEIHTGKFCHDLLKTHKTKDRLELVKRISDVSKAAHQMDLQAHIGHGLNYENAMWCQHIDHCEEANIGHAIVARAIFTGFQNAVSEMRQLLNDKSRCPVDPSY